MPIEIFDYRRDLKNVLVSSTIRGRFLRHEPGEVGPFHSHDVGDEIFLILEGRCEFTIEGEVAVLGPGELCVARPNQRHQIRVVGDEPMTMFLAVSPHLEPTHTFWDDAGNRLPATYNMTTAAEYAAVTERPSLGDQISGLSLHLSVLVDSARTASSVFDDLSGDLESGGAEARVALDEAQVVVAELHRRLFAMDEVWNDLAARVHEEADGRDNMRS